MRFSSSLRQTLFIVFVAPARAAAVQFCTAARAPQGISEYFPTHVARPTLRARSEGVPDRPTLSTTGHAARPDSGDPTDRLSPAPLAATWLGRKMDRHRPSQKPPRDARGREVCNFNFASPAFSFQR